MLVLTGRSALREDAGRELAVNFAPRTKDKALKLLMLCPSYML